MRNFLGLAILGGAMLAAIPASASTGNFNFLNCSGTGNTQCSADLSAYGPVSSTNLSGITATATAYFVQGTSSGPTTADTIQAGVVGSYNGYGLGLCENTAQVNAGYCTSPTHQIDNAVNPDSGNNVNTPVDYEFMLIQFSAAVNLSDVQLGNYGVNSGTADPFNATYFTSSAAVNSISTLTSMTYAQLTSGADGFSAAQSTTCTSGATLDQTVQSLTTANCAVNGEAVDSVSGTNVTYLLIGASVSSNLGEDFFKIQDIDANKPSATPEPATFGLLGLALTGLGVYGRKRKSTRS
jgi:hypothetical protein